MKNPIVNGIKVWLGLFIPVIDCEIKMYYAAKNNNKAKSKAIRRPYRNPAIQPKSIDKYS